MWLAQKKQPQYKAIDETQYQQGFSRKIKKGKDFSIFSFFSAPGCTILEPLYTRFDQTRQSFDGIRFGRVSLFYCLLSV